MCKSLFLRCAMVLLVVGCGTALSSAQTQPNVSKQAAARPDLPPLPEMWTNLQTHLDSSKLKPGDAVRSVVSQAWVYRTCGVQGGSTLEGTVVGVTAPTDPKGTSEISLSFAARCSGGAIKPLILIAVYFPSDQSKSQMDLYNAMPQGIGVGATGRQAMDINTLPSPDAGSPGQLPLAKMGEVKGVRHLSLAVAKGAKGSTVLSSTDKRLRLEPGTRLVLVPVPDAH